MEDLTKKNKSDNDTLKQEKKNEDFTKNVVEKCYLINYFKYIFFIIIIFFAIFISILYILKKKNNIKKIENENYNENEDIIYEPLLPLANEEHIVKKYKKSDFDYNHIRYHYNEIYDKRKIFKINYSYLPYTKIDKSISYEENAEKIYKSTGMLNITKLDYYYNNIDMDKLNFNHIHLSMSIDMNNIELSALSIASIFNTSHPYTYIHFHILVINFTFKDMQKIIQLKKINQNVEFIFYNSKQAEYDFGDKKDKINDFSRILAPEIVNNTNKLLSLVSCNIIAQKDISELYFFNLEDNYFGWALDGNAGNKEGSNLFFINNLYPNGGVILINIRLFREDNLYKNAF